MAGVVSAPAGVDRRGARIAAAIATGAVCGTAWAAAFRAYMVELAGVASRVDWVGTFVGVLLPGAVAGVLIGWAAVRNDRRRRWLGLAPLAFAVAPLALPGALVDLFTQGLGGGAIAVALLAVAGGYAVSGAGPRWARVLCGVPAGILLVGTVWATPLIAPRLAHDAARGAWVAVLAGSLLLVLVAAASIPFRPLRAPEPDGATGAVPGDEPPGTGATR